MPRPIDADALKKRAIEMEIIMPYGGDGTTMAVEVDAIESAPTLDYAPVRHGYWIPVWYDLFKLGYVKCSVCGHKEKKRGFSHCHCGALMDGQEDAHETR